MMNTSGRPAAQVVLPFPNAKEKKRRAVETRRSAELAIGKAVWAVIRREIRRSIPSR